MDEDEVVEVGTGDVEDPTMIAVDGECECVKTVDGVGGMSFIPVYIETKSFSLIFATRTVVAWR